MGAASLGTPAALSKTRPRRVGCMHKPRMTPSIEPPSVESFLKNVLRSGVLDRKQLQDALRRLPLDQRRDPEAVADHLIDSGKLSRFQAGKLLRGMAVGLVLGPFHVLAP